MQLFRLRLSSFPGTAQPNATGLTYGVASKVERQRLVLPSISDQEYQQFFTRFVNNQQTRYIATEGNTNATKYFKLILCAGNYY
jgi:hypothetical protein